VAAIGIDRLRSRGRDGARPCRPRMQCQAPRWRATLRRGRDWDRPFALGTDATERVPAGHRCSGKRSYRHHSPPLKPLCSNRHPPSAHNRDFSRSIGLGILHLACVHSSITAPARKRPTLSRMVTVYGYRLRFMYRGTGAGPCGRGYSRVPQAAGMWEAHGCVRGWCRAVIRADAPAAGASLCTDLAQRERPLAQPHSSLTALRSHPSKPLAYLPQRLPGPPPSRLCVGPLADLNTLW
jgi:hypothetical protein